MNLLLGLIVFLGAVSFICIFQTSETFNNPDAWAIAVPIVALLAVATLLFE